MRLRDLKRMCIAHTECDQCPFDAACCGAWATVSKETLDKIEANCEKWLAEHPEKPKKTRQSELLKLFPDAEIVSGVINICPDKTRVQSECDGSCGECRRKYWLAEIKDDEA